MSEEQKPVEEPVAPVVTEPVVEDKAVEETPVAPETTETDAAPAAEPAAEPTAEETPVAAVEAAATPFVGEGTLGYKAPGGNIIKYVFKSSILDCLVPKISFSWETLRLT